MAKATSRTAVDTVQFCGIPSSVTGVLPGATEPANEIVLTVRGIRGAKDAAEFSVQSDFDPRVLRLMLPPDVAPGSYAGELSVDGRAWPARVDVEAAPHLRVFPEQLRIAAGAGETVTRSLTILNAGNVTIALRTVHAIGVMLAGGIERALRRAYVSRPTDGQRRIDILADALAEAHGGLVKLSIVDGAGELPAGELRTIDVSMRIPEKLAAGADYTGNWELAGLVYPVTIQIAGSQDDSSDPHDKQYAGDESNLPAIR
jgi:hypothetical protein